MPHARLSCRPDAIEESIREAEKLCTLRGGNLTPLRLKVLTMLLEASCPVRAYDILPRLKATGAAKPPTLYRTLDFLIDMGLAHRIESLNAFVPCGHWKHDHQAIFIICQTCGVAEELDADDVMKKLTQEVRSVGFRMRAAVIEVRGLCFDCRGRTTGAFMHDSIT